MTDGEPSAASTARPGLQLFWLALPVLGEQLLILGVGQFDTFLAGQISRTATAAVGIASYVGWLATLMFSLVGTGTTALVSRSWGAQDRTSANHLFNQSVPLAFLIGLVAQILIWCAAPSLATFQNQTGLAHEITVNFLRMDAISHPFSSLTLVGAAALRGVGDMRSSLLIMLLVNVLNVILSSCLVFGFGMIEPWGVNGIVTGTVISRIIGGMLMLVMLLRGRSGLQMHVSEMRCRWNSVVRILKIGLPAVVDSACQWIGHFLFLAIIARLGSGDRGQAIFAAHYIGMEVEALTYLPAVAWGTASASLIGQSLGAGNQARAGQIGHLAVLQCGLLTVCATLFYYLFADQIYQVMSLDPLVRQMGAPALRFLSLFQVPLVMAIIYIFSLRGAGDTRTPMLFTIGSTLCIRVPVAYWCGIVMGGGLIGAWTGMVVDNSVRGVLATYRYSRGNWVHIQV